MSEAEAALRQELDEVKQRFADWKTRAKTAVEKERQKFVDISEQNFALTGANAELTANLAAAKEAEAAFTAEAAQLRGSLEAAEAATLAANARASKLEADLANAEKRAVAAEKAAEELSLTPPAAPPAPVVDTSLAEALRAELDAVTARAADLEAQVAAAAQREADAEAFSAELRAEANGRYAALSANFTVFAELALSSAFAVGSTAEDAVAAQHRLFADASAEVSNATVGHLSAAVAEAAGALERHKRNMERTMKLASRDQDGAKAEAEGLKETLRGMEEAIAREQNSVKQRDLAIAALEQRLEEAAGSLERFEADNFTTANQGHYIAELEQRIGDMEREFSDREAIVQDQHRDEVDRMLARHEEDMAALRASLEDHIRDAERDPCGGYGYGGYGAPSAAAAALGADDGAYNELLDENSRLRAEATAASEARADLQAQLLAARERLSRLEAPAAGSSGAGGAHGGHSDTSQMDAPFMRRKIFDLERQLATLGEQLLASNQQLMEHKAAARERQAMQSGGGDGSGSGGLPAQQQQAYTRAVLVKMLCAKSEDVRGSLLPVVSTLVKFTNEELKAIYAANPNWIH